MLVIPLNIISPFREGAYRALSMEPVSFSQEYI